MPNITIKITRSEAIAIHNEITNQAGQESYKEAREQVQKAILATWPEAATGKKVAEAEVRDLEINPKQQRALAEGYLSRRLNPDVTGGGRSILKAQAKLLRVSQWVENHIPPGKIEDFEGLDDEPELLDKSPGDKATEIAMGIMGDLDEAVGLPRGSEEATPDKVAA